MKTSEWIIYCKSLYGIDEIDCVNTKQEAHERLKEYRDNKISNFTCTYYANKKYIEDNNNE